MNKGSQKQWVLDGPGFIFGMSCRVGYGYWVSGSEPWTVQFAKKSARVLPSLHATLKHM